MSQSQMRKQLALVRRGRQRFRDYYRQERKRCAAQLAEAVKSAATDRDGKPIFYTILRHVSQSGMSRTISVHYVEASTGRILHLNYVASVLLDRSRDSRREGVVCKGCGMDMGFDLVYALSARATGDGYAIHHQWL